MAIKSINWWLDIEEYEGNALANSFSAGPIVRSWDETNAADPQKFMTIQELVDEINELFVHAWDEGNGDTQNLYEVIPTLVSTSETVQGSTAGQATIRFEFIRKYPIYAPGAAAQKTFKIALESGPHGAATLQPQSPKLPAARVAYTNEESVQGLTLPYWSENTVITDKPPIAPDVVFVPFLGVSNKILLLLDGNMGDLNLKPIIIKDTDSSFMVEELFSQLKLSVPQSDVRNYVKTKDVELNYRSDDPIRSYQIFRLRKKPTSYEDFNTPRNPIATISEVIAPNKPSTPATHLSTIRPNTKYYYCVRGIDIHNNISNPTEVFEVEMVDNNGQIFYTMKTYDMVPAPPDNCTMTGRRFIYIAPAPQQAVFDGETFMSSNAIKDKPENIKITDLPPENVLGYLPEDASPVWDKKFKVRVTSSKTGKKFDLNITVKNSGVNNP